MEIENGTHSVLKSSASFLCFISIKGNILDDEFIKWNNIEEREREREREIKALHEWKSRDRFVHLFPTVYNFPLLINLHIYYNFWPFLFLQHSILNFKKRKTEVVTIIPFQIIFRHLCSFVDCRRYLVFEFIITSV